MLKRVHVIFRGRVQGVGFRFTAVSLASSLKVVGWVRNKSDASVELVAEQEQKVLEDFLDSLEGQFSRYIVDRDAQWESATGEFRGFDIRA